VLEETDFRITIVEKSLKPTPEDLEMLMQLRPERARCSSYFSYLLHSLLRDVHIKGYQRRIDAVFKKHPTIPHLVYNVWIKHMDAGEWMATLVLLAATRSPGPGVHEAPEDAHTVLVVERARWIPSPLPEATLMPQVFDEDMAFVCSYRNGYLDMETLKFHPYVGQLTAPGVHRSRARVASPQSSHYFHVLRREVGEATGGQL
jgi:hypothetical protein